MDIVADQYALPDAELATAWNAVKLPQAARDRLVAQSLLAPRTSPRDCL
jgi:hypothetical protein